MPPLDCYAGTRRGDSRPPTRCIAPPPLADVLVMPPEPSPQRIGIAKEEHMRCTRRHLALAGAGALCTAAWGLGAELAAQSSDEVAIAQAVEAFRKERSV